MAKILIDLPDELSQLLKMEKIKRKEKSISDTIINLLKKYFRGEINESGGSVKSD